MSDNNAGMDVFLKKEKMSKITLGESLSSVVPNSAGVISEAVPGQEVIGSESISDSVQRCDNSFLTSRSAATNDSVQQCDTSSQQCSDTALAVSIRPTRNKQFPSRFKDYQLSSPKAKTYCTGAFLS
ncbi:hypothetical protein V6N11_078490 [Hibiscus sabdariffa]|uniref:Uncharacterized protein n=1 Tax=Hibiscus sabdariffa TaxID=183260 RepID=A0ABR2TG62_9ROSI